MYFCLILRIIRSETTAFRHSSGHREFFFPVIGFPCPQLPTSGVSPHQATDLINTNFPNTDLLSPDLCNSSVPCRNDRADMHALLREHGQSSCRYNLDVSFSSPEFILLCK